MSLERGKVNEANASEKGKPQLAPPEVKLLTNFWKDEFPKLVDKLPHSVTKEDPTKTSEPLSREYFEKIVGLPALREIVNEMKISGDPKKFTEENGWRRRVTFWNSERKGNALDITLLKDDASDTELSIDYRGPHPITGTETVIMAYKSRFNAEKEPETNLFLSTSPTHEKNDSEITLEAIYMPPQETITVNAAFTTKPDGSIRVKSVNIGNAEFDK